MTKLINKLLMNVFILLFITFMKDTVQAQRKDYGDEPDAVECIDTKKFGHCAVIKEFDICDEEKTIISLQRKCDLSCGWCSESKECVDRAPYANCAKLTQKQCNQNATFYLTRCRKSCGWCNDEGPEGIWKDWSDWSPCSVTCGPTVGSRSKSRKCLMGQCKGSKTKEGFCTASKPCPEWNAWNEWSKCSVTCGNGTRTRNRACKVPDQCVGSSLKIAPCELPKCVEGAIPFDEWTACSKTCGGGTQLLIKSCPEWDRSICPRQYRDCKMHRCPYKNCATIADYRYGSQYTQCCDQSVEKQCFRAQKKIFGGVVSAPKQFPWMARLESIGGLLGPHVRATICGGTLIHPRFVLTAAHCLEDLVPHRIHVVLGSIATIDTSAQVQRITVKNFTIHPNFTDPSNDVAILTLTREASMTNYVRPLCLADGEETPVDEHCFIAGWGLTRGGLAPRSSPNLREARIRHLPFGVCQNIYKNSAKHRDHMDENKMMCAGAISGGADTCRGDSGGPLMCQRCSSCEWYLAGVTAFGGYTCGSKYPGVYMKIIHYEDWINEEVEKYEKYGLDCRHYNSLSPEPLFG